MTKPSLLLAIMILLTSHLSSQTISAEFPFVSKYQSVGEDQIHYIDEGSGDPILFLHGIPMSAYAWRNVIPHLSPISRCIAIDFMGFGKSDKPKIDYSFNDQFAYLGRFIDSLKLDKITLVMTDIGGIIGTRYAMDHPEKIKGLVFMESPISDAETFHQTGGMMQHMMFWMGGKKKMGYNMIVKRNMFIKMMSMLIKRKLSKEEKTHYRAPFKNVESRLALFTLPNSFPKKGKNAQSGDMADFMNRNAVDLQKSVLPKLLVYAKPGMLINKKSLAWAEQNLSELKTQFLGKAKHLMEEDLPHEIGDAIHNWYKNLGK